MPDSRTFLNLHAVSGSGALPGVSFFGASSTV
jgi:hypothetical protein